MRDPSRVIAGARGTFATHAQYCPRRALGSIADGLAAVPRAPAILVALFSLAITRGAEHFSCMAMDPIPELRRQLGERLARELEGWRAADIAVVLGMNPPRVSDLRRGRLSRFSTDTLVRLCARLRWRVELHLTRARIENTRRVRVARSP